MTIKNTFNLFKKTKVFLIGDIMLDRYVFGKVSRISPEAPVPIFLSKNSKEMLGGSGNVLNNLISLGTDPYYLSLIGKDNNGVKIIKQLKKLNFKNYKLIVDPSRKTTVKTRYISSSQQIIRVDEENSENIFKNLEIELIKKIDFFIKNKDVIIISDYNKGIITKRVSEYIINKGNSLKIPVIIDPKNKNFNIYKNATLITPNQLEASLVTDLPCNNNKEAEICAKNIIKKFSIKNVLITRGSEGLSYIGKKKNIIHQPTKKIEVFDVSGAGDTVMAVLSVCISNNIPVKKSLELANSAAGIVVGKIGTSTINLSELFKEDQLFV